MSLIDDIKRDREAGTPGPWKLETVPTSCGVCHRVGEWPSRGAHKTSGACLYEDYPPTTAAGNTETYSNARRIARVPDLEAALLAADELARRVHQQQEGWPMRADYIATALAAYRKATGEIQ